MSLRIVRATQFWGQELLKLNMRIARVIQFGGQELLKLSLRIVRVTQYGGQDLLKLCLRIVRVTQYVGQALLLLYLVICSDWLLTLHVLCSNNSCDLSEVGEMLSFGGRFFTYMKRSTWCVLFLIFPHRCLAVTKWFHFQTKVKCLRIIFSRVFIFSLLPQ